MKQGYLQQGHSQNVPALVSRVTPLQTWKRWLPSVPTAAALAMLLSAGLVSAPQAEARDVFKPTAPKAQLSKLQPYRVKQGDTLDSIARIYNVSPAELIRLNQLDPTRRLRVGQTIALPKRVRNRASAATLTQNSPQPTANRAQAAPTPVPPADSSRHISQLKQEIRQLRSQRRLSTPVSRSPQLVAAASLESQPYSPLAESMLRQSVSPDLPPLNSMPFVDGSNRYLWPTSGVISSGYGWRWGRMHRGLDIAAASGTPIYAAASGTVTFSGWASGYGNLIEITHLDGSVTLYGHSRRLLVKEGQRVRAGEFIAEMGSTGRSTGPHLHFEIHPAGQGAVNPLSYLSRNNPLN